MPIPLSGHSEPQSPSLAGDAPLLVFGGPYSNLRATLAMQAEAERLRIPPQRVICTGDVVAYCAEPEETVAAVRAWGCPTIQGNCEEQLALAAEDCGCGFEQGSACDQLAKGWYPFANARVSDASRVWMSRLPRSIGFDYGGHRFRVVHGGVRQINRFVFASQTELLAEELELAAADVVIGGHAGVPFIRNTPRGVWFNPGVIGMPANDGTTGGWYGLIEPGPDGAVRLSTHRLRYAHAAAAAAMRKSGYADAYARALITGLWPSTDVLPATELAARGMPIAATELVISRQLAATA